MELCQNIFNNTQYWLKGEVNSPFYIAYNENNILYLLTYNNDEFIFSPTGINPTLFTLSSTQNGFIISTSINPTTNKFLSINDDNLLVPSELSYTFYLSTNSVNTLNTSFLAGINYNLITLTNQNVNYLSFIPTNNPTVISGFTSDIQANPITKNNIQIYAIPFTAYQCQTCGAQNDTYKLEGCWLSQDNTNCANIPKTSYFTNSNDCNLGIWYNYCPSSTFCSSNNCNGPCANGTSCTYNNVDGIYQCGEINESLQTEYWVILSIIIILIFIILIFTIIYIYRK